MHDAYSGIDPQSHRLSQIEKSISEQLKAKDTEIAELKASLSQSQQMYTDLLVGTTDAIAAKDAEIKRLREALERVMRHRVDESKSSIDNYCEIKDIARVAWKAESSPAPVTEGVENESPCRLCLRIRSTIQSYCRICDTDFSPKNEDQE